MVNMDVIEESARLDNFTLRYTQSAVDFITRSKDKPFFLYMAHSFPHIPLAASTAFAGKSLQGSYGDAVQEIDWSVGQVLQSIQANALDSNTLVMFSSDHGPWFQGSPGGLRGRKGETFEGGVRVPFIARFPGVIPGGQLCQGFATHLDILPTVASLTAAPPPANQLDGIDIRALLTGQETDLARDLFLYFNDVYLQCARVGSWKLHMARFNSPPFTAPPAEGRLNLPLPSPELYNLVFDPDESHDRSPRNAAVISDIRNRVLQALQSFPPDIMDAWNRTMALQVEGTPAGCSPIPKH